jgi:hypothetical protein
LGYPASGGGGRWGWAALGLPFVRDRTSLSSGRLDRRGQFRRDPESEALIDSSPALFFICDFPGIRMLRVRLRARYRRE